MSTKTIKPPRFWLIAFPTFQYVEDVKAVAQSAGLVIVDEAAAGDYERANAVEGPELTLRGDADDEAGDEAAEQPKRPRGRQAGSGKRKAAGEGEASQ